MSDVPILDDSLLSLKDGIDITKLGLTAPEGFLLSRIQGEIPVGEVYTLSVMDRTTTAMVIKRMVDLGVLLVRAPGPKAPRPVRAAPDLTGAPVFQPARETASGRPRTPEMDPSLGGDGPTHRSTSVGTEATTSAAPGGKKRRDYTGFVFNPAEIGETDLIELEIRKEILYVSEHVDNMTHYELLLVDPRATSAEVRKAYHDQSRIYHPDNYFGLNIGGFRDRVTRVFKRMTDAMMTLTNEEKRERYNNDLVKRGILQPAAFEALKDAAEEARKAMDAEIERRRRESRLKANPMMARIEKAKSYGEQAAKQLEAGDVQAAYNTYRMAQSIDPMNPKWDQQARELEPRVAELKAARFLEMAKTAMGTGDEDFLQLFKAAADAAPTSPQFVVPFAEHLIEYGGMTEAAHYLNRVVRANPKAAEAWFTLGLAYMKAKKREDAARCFETVVQLQPKNERAKDLLKKAKQWFDLF